MEIEERYTAFVGFTRIVTGSLKTMLTKTKEYLDAHVEAQVLIFDNSTGRQVDFNFHGTVEEVLRMAMPSPEKRGPGRPRLGVVCGEVSLLPRHWEWLARQPKRASGTIRNLVESASKNTSAEDRAKQQIEAVGNFMWAMTGNLPGFEEASRALYAQKWETFERLTSTWPEDVRGHLDMLLEPLKKPHEIPGKITYGTLEVLKERYDRAGQDVAPWQMSAVGLAAAIRGGDMSASSVVDAFLTRIERVNPEVNGITMLFASEARKEAARIDERRARGESLGPFAGVPFTIKGNIDVAGYATTHGIPALRQSVPDIDAPVVRRLRDAGAIPIGHTNLPDISLRFHTKSRLYGATINPWNAGFSPGGSSGGEGASLATGMSAIGLGNDAGGSVRIPALFCGVAALKPGYGRFPDDRSVGPRNMTLASQLIPVNGLLARSIADLHLAYQVAAGVDSRDPRVVPAPLFGPRPRNPVRVAVTPDPGNLGASLKVRRSVEYAAEILAGAGYVVEPAELPELTSIVDAYNSMIMTEFFQGFGTLERLVGPETLSYLRLAMEEQKPKDLAGYLGITAMRQGYARKWAGFFDKYPLVLGPVFTEDPVPPDFDIRGQDEYRHVARAMRLCSATSFIGVPAVAVPTAAIDGQPYGVQLISRPFREDLCLEAAAVIEASTGLLAPIDPR